jgi:signal peptidase
MATAARFFRIALVWALATLVVGVTAFAVLPSLAGYRSMTVLSGSMTPTLDVGAIVIGETIRPTEARVGDIVTFPDPKHRGRTITHRLKRIRVEGTTAYMVTRGDANDTAERWNVPVSDEIVRVAYHLPKVGYARAWLTSRIGRLAAVTAVVFLLGLVLIELWRPTRTQPEDSLAGALE